MQNDKFIDIEQLFRSKNPAILKWLPKFILNYLKRVIHQEEINDFMFRNKLLKDYEFSKQVIKEFNIKVEIEGIENVPRSGGVILVGNHPLGGMDGIALVTALDGIRNDVTFIVNDLLMNITNLNGIFVGVNKHGRNVGEQLQVVEKLFASDKAVFLFPAGLVSRKRDGVVKDLEWKKTFVTRARKYDKMVVPVYTDGSLTNFFYNLSILRTKLGVKANIEMLYLADEMYKQKGKTMKIVFGKPIPASTFNSSKSDAEWANWTKEQVYKMK
jgi:1-acyl-sn-glycerol-3-phosphate acyltransferase